MPDVKVFNRTAYARGGWQPQQVELIRPRDKKALVRLMLVADSVHVCFWPGAAIRRSAEHATSWQGGLMSEQHRPVSH